MSFLSGWPAVILIGVVFFAVSVVALHFAARDWRSGIAILVVSLPLMPLLAMTVFGDVSRYVPAGMFSDGPDGVGQIVISGALLMLFGAIILSCVVVGLANIVVRTFRSS
jgi:hypothetical protein